MIDTPKSRSKVETEFASRSSIPLARFHSPTGWLFKSRNKTPRMNSRRGSIAQEHGPSALAMSIMSMTFHNLPTEIHFQIATYLPDHTLLVLSRHGYSARLRHIYKHADPKEVPAERKYLSDHDYSIYKELCMRDDFEKTPYTHIHSSSFYTIVWSKTMFHCSGCQKSVGCAHFSLDEMKESVERRTGMSKIIERKCIARTTPVKLWDNRITTWDCIQQAWTDMDGEDESLPLLSDHGQNVKQSSKGRSKPGRYTDVPNTLKIRDLGYIQARHPGGDPRQSGVEAVAEYYVDLYTPLRFASVDGTTVAALIKEKAPYTCPHLDMANLMSRPMSGNPIDFRPIEPLHAPGATVADLLCKTLDRSHWKPDPSARYQRPGKPPRKFKEQAVWCGFKSDKCRTAVSLQRFRDNTAVSTVGSPWWMRDLVRLKVTRKWRVDQGTGDEEWQAQNGVSVKTSRSVE